MVTVQRNRGALMLVKNVVVSVLGIHISVTRAVVLLLFIIPTSCPLDKLERSNYCIWQRQQNYYALEVTSHVAKKESIILTKSYLH
ncbi:hypothetical protein EJ08DRAFT_227987 [Tothia fuscella]|uniref:Uncharacterized protein n=1 Tax=Tothia fuscella TaxID=1048955 RepID=A0A9P4P3M1_9PEZI|nr:hypothetical protein EJ08DRAFT_227987 [Tothia fuscella]